MGPNRTLFTIPENSGRPSFLILGCGHFGERAVRTFLERNPQSRVTVVDSDRESIGNMSRFPVEGVVSDALLYLTGNLSGESLPDYIIPAIPIHVAFEYLLTCLKPRRAARAAVPSLHGLPNPVRGSTGDLYVSHSNFLCPEDCPEPALRCTVTGKRRSTPLFQLLENRKGAFESRVIRSFPLGPGVGGIQPKALLALRDELWNWKGDSPLFLVSTACRCHGVVSALSL